MDQLCWLNGEWISAEQLSISVVDTGFVLGVTVSEQLRTFGGRLFQLDEHLRRLSQSLLIIGIDGLDMDELKDAAMSLAAHNHGLMHPKDDLGLTIFVTPGSMAASVSADSAKATVAMHTAPVSFQRWSDKYATGETLVVSSVRQVPASCWPPELKCRSRMHYFLADREAARIKPGARALLLDQDGFLAEASTASVVLHRPDEGLVAPPAEKTLPSVSVGVLKSLAAEAGIEFQHRDLTLEDVRTADEMFLSSTSPCLLPAVTVDDAPVGDGKPGPVFQQLIDRWSRLVGLKIVDQAVAFSSR